MRWFFTGGVSQKRNYCTVNTIESHYVTANYKCHKRRALHRNLLTVGNQEQWTGDWKQIRMLSLRVLLPKSTKNTDEIWTTLHRLYIIMTKELIVSRDWNFKQPGAWDLYIHLQKSDQEVLFHGHWHKSQTTDPTIIIWLLKGWHHVFRYSSFLLRFLFH